MQTDGTPEAGELEYQRNPDGSITATFDIDADGEPETVTVRGTQLPDGTPAMAIDVDGDGEPDLIAVDENADGRIDLDELRAPDDV